MRAPLLQTPRLILRGHRTTDFRGYARMWTDPRVTRYVGKPSTRQETWSRLLRNIGHWEALGFGYWVILERTTRRFVGEVGFADLHRELRPSLSGIPEAGWMLTPAAWGKGYATEAVQAALGWIGARRWSATVCMIAPKNAGSMRVAEKCGYRFWKRARYGGSTVMLFRRPRVPR